MGRDDLSLMKGLKLLGQSTVKEEIHALYTRRSSHHPLVQKLLQSAQA
jgi:LysR family transcriptional activator of nhaA